MQDSSSSISAEKLPRETPLYSLNTDFEVPGGRLGLGVPYGVPLGHPKEAFLRIYRWQGAGAATRAYLIGELGDLRGQVRIGSSQAALSYVRLFTSLRTHFAITPPKLAPLVPVPTYYQEEGKLEIIRQDLLDTAYFYGDKEKPGLYHKDSQILSGYNGIITAEAARRYSLPPATSVAAGKGFRVRRALAVHYRRTDRGEPSVMDRLFVTQEWVGADGSYVWEQARPLAADLAKELHVQFPTYE